MEECDDADDSKPSIDSLHGLWPKPKKVVLSVT